MKTVIHRAEDRGVGQHGWLSTRFSFSFANWYNPARMGFGKLRVLNDDRVAPASGFPMHPHKDMEIITIVTEGTVTHKDSMGNAGVVKVGDVQVMSAGTGVVHSEYNESEDETLTLFQIWIEPKAYGIQPRYDQKSFGRKAKGLETLVGPLGSKGALGINQEAWISRASVNAKSPVTYKLHGAESGVYVFVVDGEARVGEETLGKRDAVGISETKEVTIEGKDADVLLIEVPL